MRNDFDFTNGENPTDSPALSSTLVEGDDPMEVDGVQVKETESPSTEAIDEDTLDVVDVDCLRELLQQIKEAGNKIAGKDILLLMGATGAGKTTTTLKLAGAKFVETEVGGVEHYEPSGLPREILDEFVVSGSATSVTKVIHATTVTLPDDGGCVTICDTPGFGDTKGVEMEISNGLGVIHALKQARSVKPVLVFDREGMSSSRYALLRKTLSIVILMMGKQHDFSAFEYVFARCDGKKRKNIHKQLSHFQESRGAPSNDEEATLDALLNDMIQKTCPMAINIEPDDEDSGPEKLKLLWCNDNKRLDNPATAFHDFVSKESSDKLKDQVNRMLNRMRKALKQNGCPGFQVHLEKLSSLADAIPLSDLSRAVNQGQEMGRDSVEQVRSQLILFVGRMVKTENLETLHEMIPEFQSLLESFRQMSSISKLCQIPAEEHFDCVLSSIIETIFGGIQNGVTNLKETPEAADWHTVLHGALLRVEYTVGALFAVADKTELHSSYMVTIDAASNLIKFHLGCAEEILDDVTSDSLKKSQHALCSLLEVRLFLRHSESDNHSTVFDSKTWAWLEKRLDTVLARLDKHSKTCMKKLVDHTESIDESADFMECTALFALSADEEVTDCRSFLSLLSSLPIVWNAVRDYSSDINEIGTEFVNPKMAVAHFNEVLSRALTDFATFSQDWVTAKRGHSERKKAEQLLVIVETALQLCNSYPESANQTPESLSNTKGRLDAFVDKCKSVPQRPDELLYGPDVLGKRFHNRLLELRAYKIQHGDCDVPRNYKTPGLGQWVHNMRCDAKRIEQGMKPRQGLNDQKIEALADLDFLWVSPRSRR